MRETLPLLEEFFPAIRRSKLETLQVNVGYRCNQTCCHCHVNAGPNRTEEMTNIVADLILQFLRRQNIQILDITGGAPELNPHFRRLVHDARKLGAKVLDRCNLTILEQAGQEDLAQFLASEAVESSPQRRVIYRIMSSGNAARAFSTARFVVSNALTPWAMGTIQRSPSISSTIRRAQRSRRRKHHWKLTTGAS